MPIHVFRVLKGAEAVRDDFRSDLARGKRPRDTSSDALTRHHGFSVWRTERQARTVASRFPKLGPYIAEVELPPGATLLPFRDAPDHLTAFGEADAFVQAVVQITPVK